MKLSLDSAVSPVIGILLMLVVTIIIAAVVSAFAGGMVKDEKKTPQATFGVSANVNSIKGVSDYPDPTYTYPAGYTEDKNYVEFEHKGGDTLTMGDIGIQFQSGDTKMTLGTDSIVNQTGTKVSCRADPKNSTYFNQVGESDGYVSAGDKFRVICDGNYDYYGSKYMFYVPNGAPSGQAITIGKDMDYKIIDKKSDKIITSGSFRATM